MTMIVEENDLPTILDTSTCKENNSNLLRQLSKEFRYLMHQEVPIRDVPEEETGVMCCRDEDTAGVA